MKCYIFSNCLKSSPADYRAKVKKLNIMPEDHLIFLNKGNLLYPYRDYFNQFKHIHMVMRNCKRFGIPSYFGFDDAYEYAHLFEDVCGVTADTAEVTLVRGKYDKTNSCKTSTIHSDKVQEYIDKTKCVPTTGYLAYYLAPILTGVKETGIILVNFYGNNDNSTGKWNGHAWSFEDEWLKGRIRVFC